MGRFQGLFRSASPTSRRAKQRASRSPTCRWSATTARRPSRCRSTQLPSTTRLLDAEVTVRMREAGGRAVERSLDLGIRPEGDDDRHQAGFRRRRGAARRNRQVQRHRRRPGRQPQGAGRRARGRWSRSSATTSGTATATPGTTSRSPPPRPVANGTLDIAADGEAAISMPVDWGRYRLEIETADPTARPPASSSMPAGTSRRPRPTRRTGWRSPSTRSNYAAGEVAKLKISPRFAGELAGHGRRRPAADDLHSQRSRRRLRRSTFRSPPTGAPAPM